MTATTADYTTPITNLNGSDPKVLFKEWSLARHSLITAREDLRMATCHGRDFQSQPTGTVYKALDEKSEALQALDAAIDLATAWVMVLMED